MYIFAIVRQNIYKLKKKTVMIKSLRYSLMAAAAMVSSLSFAQTTIDFTAQTVTTVDKVGYTLTAEGYTFKAEKSSGTTVPTQNATSHDLRHYASNTLTISGPEMKQIVFTMSAAGLKQWGEVTPSVGTVTVDTENGTTTWTSDQACTELTLTVGKTNDYGTNTAKTAAQFDLSSAVISAEAGSGEQKKSAGLEFSEATVNHEVGTEFTAPTFSKATTAAVTFASDNEAVATVNAEGVISLAGAEGKAVITATAEANDQYNAGTATCTVYVYHMNAYKKATAVESGKKYLIVAQRDNKTYYAMPAKETYTYGYLSTQSVDGYADEIQIKSSYDDNFLFETLGEGFSICDCYGRYLFMDSDHASFQFGDEPSTWTVAPADNGTFTITNNDKFIQWGSGTFTTFGAYTDKQDGTVLPMLYVLSNTESGLNGVQAETKTVKSGVRYNLAGQRVNNSFKGIVIENGKKVVVK